jgi:DNA-binding response OmpR family regulator
MLQSHRGSRFIRILVVDDDSGIRHFVEKVLVLGGHEVVLADNGTQALREIERSPFALVITDVLMPGADGLEVIRRLRKQPGAPKIIAMSGGRGRNSQYLEVAGNLGAIATIEKPFTIEQLSSAVRAAEA